MSSDPEITRIVRSWLDEGVTALPDRVLDAVLDQVPATPRRRSTWWPAPWSRPTNNSLVVALAGAAVTVAITLIGLGLLVGDRVGGPGTDDAAPSPTSSVTDLPTGFTSIEAGRYRLGIGLSADVTFEVPEGWSACGYSAFEQGVCRPSTDAGGVSFLAVENVVVHPCDNRLADPPAGRSIDSFLAAVGSLANFSVTEPVEITRGDLAGQQLIVTAPADPQCQELRTWSVPGRTNGVHAGEVNVLDVFDVGGRLLAVAGAYRPGVLSSDEIAEIRAIMESVEIRP
jgi:hypothetical protein